MILCSYVLGHVQKVVQQPTYEVAFDDGSVCTNLPPGDILVSTLTLCVPLLWQATLINYLIG